MQDWFATEHTLLDLIDAARKKWPVKTADQFHKLLCQNYAPLAKKLPSPSTLRGWFTFAGTSAASFPVPKITWTEGYTARYNVRLRISEGRPIKLLGCDEAVMQTKLWVKALRMRNIPISTPQVRGVLLAQLIATGKDLRPADRHRRDRERLRRGIGHPGDDGSERRSWPPSPCTRQPTAKTRRRANSSRACVGRQSRMQSATAD